MIRLFITNYPEQIIFNIINDMHLFFIIKSQVLDATNSVSTSKLFKLQKHDYFNENYHSAFLDQYSYSYAGMNMRPDGIKEKNFLLT